MRRNRQTADCPAVFPIALAPICEAFRITIRDDGAAGIFLRKVRLKQAAKEAATK